MNILRVHLGDATQTIESLSGTYRNLGGRGLTSRILSQEVPPHCAPLEKENKLIFAPGILAGTRVPNSGRLSIGAKSPFTKGIEEANAGGTAAHRLARLGFQAVVFEECCPEWTILKIDRHGLTRHSARELVGKGLNEAIAWLRQTHGDSVSIVAIGHGGEKGLLTSEIGVTSSGFFPPMTVRGGLGAVMGAKKVKALIIDDSGCPERAITDQALFAASVKAFGIGIASHHIAYGFKQLGPPRQVDVSQFLQRYFAAFDTLGIFFFAALPPLDKPELQQHLIDCVGAVLDESLEENYFMRLGAMVLEEERKFNKAAGCTKLQVVSGRPAGLVVTVHDNP